eukprot:6173014-Pleurochrysis_carterae.AAC.1
MLWVTLHWPEGRSTMTSSESLSRDVEPFRFGCFPFRFVVLPPDLVSSKSRASPRCKIEPRS